MAAIIDHGMRKMLVEQKDFFYYVTQMNENYDQKLRITRVTTINRTQISIGSRSNGLDSATAAP